MGRVTRSGHGYGMTEQDAMLDFKRRLSQEYGEGAYQGGGQDIRNWLKSKCIEKPVKGKSSKQTSTADYKKEGAVLVNGFVVTNFDDQQKMLCFFDQKPVAEKRDLALTQTEAKKQAKMMALRYNETIYILPARLWKDKYNRLSEADKILSVSPKGGTKDKDGKWYFEVECAY